MSHMNRKILVIDDQESIRDDFVKILGSGGAGESGASSARSAFFGEEAQDENRVTFELSTASQGEEGMQVLRDHKAAGNPFAMAFVDMRMPPGIDGLQAIRGLWEIDEDLQVVICTAYSDYSFEEIIDELGQSDRLLILKKPFDPVEVRQLAAALTGKWNVARRERAQMDELRVANQRAEAASQAKSDFLANMSHEIRTPMNALLGYVDLMCDPDATDENRARYGQTVRKSGEHLLNILNDILDVSRIEASRLVVNAADFSPFGLAHEVASLLRSQALEKDLTLSLEVAGAIPQIVESDLVRVRQVLLNLVGNAIKFTEEGNVRLVVRLDGSVESDHRYVCFDVIDTGVGIPEADLDMIFEPFSQVDTSSTREYGGSGLGLTICRRLALLLGGDVEVRSQVGVGTTFTLKLYAGELTPTMLRDYTAEECRLDGEDGAGEDAAAQFRDANGEVTVDARVLIVEDVKFNQLLVGALMRRAGAEVALAGNGKEGYEMAVEARRRGEPFDLVLMDMQMPVMDGYEATRKLRADGFDLPIVALTARAMVGDRDKCIEVGCTEYATKPLDKEKLLLMCSRLVALERAGAALPRTEEIEQTE